MRTTTVLIFHLLALIPCVAAHGFVSELTVDGKSYTGNSPTQNGEPTNPSVIRRISKIDPVKGATNAFVNCGNDASPASLNANANPGSALTFKWVASGQENWPHNTGPMLTYMANCGDTTCDQFDSSNAKWFKIQQVSFRSDGSTWAQQDLMDGQVASVTLPSNIAPGNYMIRHEIIALHLANSMGGAEFYPSCSQLIISGSGTGVPKSGEIVSLPGAYADDDPGIYVPDIYGGLTDYAFPGPAIASFVTSGNSDNTTTPASTSQATSTTLASTSQATSTTSASTATKSSSATSSSHGPKSTVTGSSSSSSSSGKCRLIKGNTLKKRHLFFPRHLGRVMRGLLHSRSS